MNLSSKVDSIALKIRQLGLKLEQLQMEKAALKKENSALKNELERQHKTVDTLKYNLDQTHSVLNQKWENEPEQSKKLRKEIDQYIKEIDKCIEWLHNS